MQMLFIVIFLEEWVVTC